MYGKMRVFGHIPGVNIGDVFKDRKALARSGVHAPPIAGISGSQNEGADSIVLSGGYEDDEDYGEVIIYTGAGGQSNGKQVANQVLEGVNLALAKSKINKLPIRVTRGFKHKHELSPPSGYKYCGLYFIDNYWLEKGKSGFDVWRYRLIAQEMHTSEKVVEQPPKNYKNPTRKLALVNQIVRDYQKAINVKSWHKHQCQVCGLAIETPAGLYAEAAHIKPLGKPHNGPDIEGNILCLCPNHHVMFDSGGFAINDDMSLIGISGKLRTATKHKIQLQFIHYHREHYSKNTS